MDNLRINFVGSFGSFYIGAHLKCESCPEKTFLIVDGNATNLWVVEIFKIIGQFDIYGKNPLLWFVERML